MQQAQINDLQQQLISALVQQKAAIALDNAATVAEATGNSLAQNTPNPFSSSTVINYSIAPGVRSAQMMLFDMNGKWVDTYSLSVDSDRLTLEASTLQPGMYIYTLVCDNREIDSKRMILTK